MIGTSYRRFTLENLKNFLQIGPYFVCRPTSASAIPVPRGENHSGNCFRIGSKQSRPQAIRWRLWKADRQNLPVSVGKGHEISLALISGSRDVLCYAAGGHVRFLEKRLPGEFGAAWKESGVLLKL